MGKDAAGAFIDDYLAYLLARASHLISAEFHVVVRRARLPVLQWRVLATLADAQVSSIGEVADIVLVPQSTLTRVAARMVQAGLLLRAEDVADRRITRVRLSAKGLKLAARAGGAGARARGRGGRGAGRGRCGHAEAHPAAG